MASHIKWCYLTKRTLQGCLLGTGQNVWSPRDDHSCRWTDCNHSEEDARFRCYQLVPHTIYFSCNVPHLHQVPPLFLYYTCQCHKCDTLAGVWLITRHQTLADQLTADCLPCHVERMIALCRGGHVIVQLEGDRSFGRPFKKWETKSANLLLRCGRGFTGYWSCDWSDILLLENDSDEHWHRTENQNSILCSWRLRGTSLLPWIQSDRINCKVWRTMSTTAKFHSTTHHKTWDATTARFNLDQGSSQLQCISSETELKKSKVWPWSDFLVSTQPNRRSLDLLMTVAYINYELRTRYLPVAYTTQMADKYGILPEEHVLDLKKLSNTRYIQCILRLILLFSK